MGEVLAASAVVLCVVGATIWLLFSLHGLWERRKTRMVLGRVLAADLHCSDCGSPFAPGCAVEYRVAPGVPVLTYVTCPSCRKQSIFTEALENVTALRREHDRRLAEMFTLHTPGWSEKGAGITLLSLLVLLGTVAITLYCRARK